MALFESKDEKKAKQAAKEQADLEKLAARYHLDLATTDPAILDNLRAISSALAGSSLLEAGVSLQFGADQKAYNLATLNLQRALFEQNWIIIRELQKLSR